MPSFYTRCWWAIASALAFPAALSAQDLNALTPISPAPAPLDDQLSATTQSALARGQELLDNNNPGAVAVLREAAQSALKALNATTHSDALKATSFPEDDSTQPLLWSAIRSHALWGRAADQFGRRDESITALVRAKTLLSSSRVVSDSTLLRDVNLELNGLLRNGLPLVAPDDVLVGIAARSHENLWQPRRFDFAPTPKTSLDVLPKAGLLVTDGQLFPPQVRNQGLTQIPPYYQPPASTNAADMQEALDRLPPSLKLNRMVAGYTRVNSGANTGQWRQTVRVFYASPFLTQDKRDDSTRAEALATQFLKVHSLYQSQLGAENLYTRGDRDEGVTTLYLLEISALWPQDDTDPVVLANTGPRMPPVNTGPKPAESEAPITPVSRPWQAIAGQNEATPGEIMFWKAGMARSEGEWLRELAHEYGHVALPPFGGFRPPLEPYGNGLLGETLSMMWAAQNPDALDLDGKTDSSADFLLHVRRQAVPARAAFVNSDPTGYRPSGSSADLLFLQGLTVSIERAYGAPLLGRVFAPLSQRSVGVQSIAARRVLLNTQSLLDGLGAPMRARFMAKKSLPVYLPALLNVNLDAPTLVNRAPVALRAGTQTTGWVYVPEGATTLSIDSVNISALGTPFKREKQATRIYYGGKSGWQRLTLVARANTTLQSARFE